MSDDFGLVVKNNSGGTMFDSRRGMNSYVIREMGTASAVSDTTNISDELIFIRPPVGQTGALGSKILYASPRVNGYPCGFYQYDDSTRVWGPVTLDYFVVTHSKNITFTDGHGLQVRNSDDSVQFDSRSIKLGSHFLITTYHPPHSVPGDGGQQYFLGDVNDYWEIGKWTLGLMGSQLGEAAETIALQGIQFFGDEPRAWGIYDQFGEEGGSLGAPVGVDDDIETGSLNNTSRTYRDIRQMIVSAELL
jgi:hypothetical protein